MKKLIILYVTLVISMVTYLVLTTHTGTLRKQKVWIEKPEIDWANPDRNISNEDKQGKDSTGYKELHRNNSLMAVIGSDTVPYYAASATRCDELYKYCHFIGQGNITGSAEILNFYVPNDNYRLITVDQMLAERNDLNRQF